MTGSGLVRKTWPWEPAHGDVSWRRGRSKLHSCIGNIAILAQLAQQDSLALKGFNTCCQVRGESHSTKGRRAFVCKYIRRPALLQLRSDKLRGATLPGSTPQQTTQPRRVNTRSRFRVSLAYALLAAGQWTTSASPRDIGSPRRSRWTWPLGDDRFGCSASQGTPFPAETKTGTRQSKKQAAD